jgi:hypothetical protein
MVMQDINIDLTNSASAKRYFYNPLKKYIAKIYGYTGNLAYEAELQPIYNRILSSFKFLTGSGEREPNPHQL